MFNNLALWGEKKFVSELKRTYKFKRGVNRHTEDNSPKYSMVGNCYDKSSLRAYAKQSSETVITRSDERRSNRIHLIPHLEIKDFGLPASGGHDSYQCSINANLEPLSCLSGSLSTKCRQGHTHRHSSAVPFVSTRGEGKKKNSLAAFTLAEVLVTLGIIGVVSAMTVPTLMQNYQRQSYVTQLHKAYNELSQALLRYETDRNALNLKEAGLTTQAAGNEFLRTYFKVVKDCGGSMTPCFASDYKKINGTALNIALINYPSVVLPSGQAVGIHVGSSYGHMFAMLVDVNGAKGPNIQGRDLFEIFVYDTSTGIILDDADTSGSMAAPLSEARRNFEFNNYCIAGSAGNFHGCFGKILNDNWEMTY